MALNLAFETVGSGPPLLVLHGLFGSSSNWRGVAHQLATARPAHTVHSVDLRNHGASPWADSMDYVEMADDVLQLMDRLDLKQAAVMGHSMGGKTAMALALRHPQRVSRLFVIDIAPVPYADTLTPFAAAMRSIDMLAVANRVEVQRHLQRAVPDPDVVPFLMQNLVTHDERFDWRINLLGISAAMPQLCGFPSELLGARFDRPLAVIAGGKSVYVPQDAGAAFQPMFTQVEVEVIADAGHWVHADHPAAFVACVQRGLSRDTQSARDASAH